VQAYELRLVFRIDLSGLAAALGQVCRADLAGEAVLRVSSGFSCCKSQKLTLSTTTMAR
jgi:hypothetical protein